MYKNMKRIGLGEAKGKLEEFFTPEKYSNHLKLISEERFEKH